MVQFSKSLNCKDCQFKSHFFLKLGEEEFDVIDRNRIEVRFKKGDVIVKQGTSPSHVIYMIDGLAKLFIEGNTNNNVTLQIITPKTYIGLEAVFSEDAFSESILNYSVTAIEDSTACFIDINSFRNIVRNNGAFAYEMINYISKKSNLIYDKVKNLTQKNSRGRLADALLYLSEIYGSSYLNLTLTRKDLAELAGTSLENSIRILSELKKEDIIRVDGRSIEIVNHKLLKKIQELG
jgi:CRP/FNR family transcriptional regulator